MEMQFRSILFLVLHQDRVMFTGIPTNEKNIYKIKDGAPSAPHLFFIPNYISTYTFNVAIYFASASALAIGVVPSNFSCSTIKYSTPAFFALGKIEG